MSEHDDEDFAQDTLSQAVENQLEAGEPAFVQAVLNKLALVGYEREAIIVLMARVLADEIDLMLTNDIARATHAADLLCPHLGGFRRDVLIEMCFQLGAGGVSKFKRFLAALESHQWGKAADEMLDSKWSQQTPARAQELAEVMRGAE